MLNVLELFWMLFVQHRNGTVIAIIFKTMQGFANLFREKVSCYTSNKK